MAKMESVSVQRRADISGTMSRPQPRTDGQDGVRVFQRRSGIPGTLPSTQPHTDDQDGDCVCAKKIRHISGTMPRTQPHTDGQDEVRVCPKEIRHISYNTASHCITQMAKDGVLLLERLYKI
jgi:hypothetical protein